MKLHGLKFAKPATKGQIIQITTQVVLAGTTSLTVYGKVTDIDGTNISVDGFITFVCVDSQGKKKPHGIISPLPENEEEARLMEQAKNLK